MLGKVRECEEIGKREQVKGLHSDEKELLSFVYLVSNILSQFIKPGHS